jgi:hypothetical protein
MDQGEQMPEQPGSAAASFDQIREGSQRLLLTMHAKMAQIKEALDNGEFSLAHQQLMGAAGMLHPLAMAEQILGFMGKGHITRAEDLAIGMELVNMGKIIDFVERECSGCAGTERFAHLDSGGFVSLEPGNEYVVADEPAT